MIIKRHTSRTHKTIATKTFEVWRDNATRNTFAKVDDGDPVKVDHLSVMLTASDLRDLVLQVPMAEIAKALGGDSEAMKFVKDLGMVLEGRP